MVVTTGVFMGKLGKETEEAVGKLIGENFQNQVIDMCWDGWTGVLPRLSAPFHTLYGSAVNDQSYTMPRALLSTNNKIPRYFDAAASQHRFVFVGD